ncbi:hypothetical protein EXIGLDRAFT_646890 [Exidia glandulosa HHB12029]|uniref:Crossover junction endonuclease MUS81 n=1 Tax=Exidia glandulosa HHB12029 TaxID=1314781 RepID=A0A166AKF8_EXIGL|nr:hypothetical protein EXIGLDRAFT_646890 [Exidia glandulosa HHB12029]
MKEGTAEGMVAAARARGSGRGMDFGPHAHRPAAAVPAPAPAPVAPAPPPPVVRPSQPAAQPDAAFPFFYIDENDTPTRSQDAAVKDFITANGETAMFHKIVFPSHAYGHILVASGSVRQCTERGNGEVWAWLADAASHALDVAPGYVKAAAPVRQANEGAAAGTGNADRNLAAEAALRRRSSMMQVQDRDVEMRPASPVASSSRIPAAAPPAPRPHHQDAPHHTQPAPRPAPAPAPEPAAVPRAGRARPRLTEQMPIPRFDGSGELRIDSSCIGLDGMDALADKFDEFVPIVLAPGTYKIVCVVDQREDRRADEARDRMCRALQESGVRCMRKSLNLGDVLWVAQVTGQHKRHDEYDEVALDFIIERKRLDDLISSIKEPRYHDQKFRLHASAISHVYYLVEGHNNARYTEEYGQQIATVVSSTQVVDGFMVKETDSWKDTVRYLAHLHGAIEEYYSGQSISVIPSPHVRPYSYVALQKHLREIRYKDIPMHTSYQAFQKNNSKSGHITVSEAWARMLLGVNGLSAAKVAAIRAEYPGPKQLRAAFKNAEAVEAAQTHDAMEVGAPKRGRGKPKISKASDMLTQLDGKGRETIGPTLSKRIHRLMRASAYDADDVDGGDSDDD